MKKVLSFLTVILLLLSGMYNASAVTVGDDIYNVFKDTGHGSANFDGYYKYLEDLKTAREKEYTPEELEAVYNQISFYMVNRQAITTEDKDLKDLFNSLLFINIRANDVYNCVEVIIMNLNDKKTELFKEYICDSDAVVLWNVPVLNAPEGNPGVVWTDVGVEASPTWIKLKAGNTKGIPIADKSKVKLWKSSNSKSLSVKSGSVRAHKKGKGVITAVYSSAVEVNLNYEVTSNPTLTLNGKKVSSVTVKKKKTKTLIIVGKVSSIANKYKNTKKAKVISKTNSSSVKIKGLKKGKTTLLVTVNNSYTFKIKVTVKK